MGLTEAAAPHVPRRWTAPLLLFLVSLALFSALFLSFPVLYDTDSYYHLAIGRAYLRLGGLDGLPWARFSLMHDGFGDKELLFHYLLAPFQAGDLGPQGGRLALAFLNASIVLALALLGERALDSRWGYLLPLLVYLGSPDFWSRAIRLRPELLSLLLLLLALACAGTRRYRTLGVVAFAYTLSYTAFHVLLGLCLLWLLARGIRHRRWDWALLLYPLLGAGLALLLHPDFPHNLVVWKVQSVDFFRWQGELDVGSEIRSPTSETLLVENLGWLLGCALLGLAMGLAGRADVMPARLAGVGEGGEANRERDDDWAAVTLVAAFAFSILYLLGRRFAVYAVPLLTLAMVFELRRRGYTARSLASLRRLAPGARTLLAAGLALVIVVSLLPTARRLQGMAGARGELEREDDWRQAARLLPFGARVAAEWGRGQLYMYFAPQAAFLNVLDPVFMALPYPEAYRAQRSLFDALEPDVPLLLARDLDSEYLMISRYHRPSDLLARLAGDPRMAPLYSGYTLVYQAVASRNQGFALDWRLVPPGSSLPVSRDQPIGAWQRYPRAAGPLRELEGFVEMSRFDTHANTCTSLVTDLGSPAGGQGEGRGGAKATTTLWELAPWGPTRLWIEEQPRISVRASPRAVLGRGLVFLIPEGARVSVETCPDSEGQRAGFYLLPRRDTAHAGSVSM